MNARWPLNKFSKTGGNMAQSGTMVYRGTWDPSGNLFPTAANTTPAEPASIKKGYTYKANADGNPNGVVVVQGQMWTANKDNPGNLAADWDLL
jgi:hypothetical protein